MMRTINGKLIAQGEEQLESEIINISHKQDQKYTQEIDAIKHRLTQLDKKCILLEESLSKQFNQFVIINVCSVLGLLFILSSMQTNNQQSNREVSQSNSQLTINNYPSGSLRERNSQLKSVGLETIYNLKSKI